MTASISTMSGELELASEIACRPLLQVSRRAEEIPRRLDRHADRSRSVMA
ncbi:hypothetical protein OCK02_08100 [Rhizobium sp. TRM96647]|nr:MULTISPECIES: hypothetical protein [unclassified Rhizobium]MCV3736165.1 hypothetical protein [Rhizobium sp. TRM96647]MCV3758173.1 hypothetical protein [Rhizobium sp. TRM96650]